MAESKNLDLFLGNADKKTRAVLKDKFTPVKMEKGQYVFFEGDEPTSLYLIESGVTEANIVHGDGRLHIFHFDFPGNFFGEGILYNQMISPFSVQIRKDVEMWKITKREILPLVENDPVFKKYLFKELGRKLDRSYMKAHCTVGAKVDKRVMCTLVRSLELRGMHHNCPMRLDTPLTNRDISGLIGSTEESVSRIMSRLKREGIISTEKKSIIVLDRDTLMQKLQEE